jgi:flagellar FliJ protein
MKKFRFRLEKLLEHRRNQEDEAATALAQAMEAVKQANANLENIIRELAFVESERLQAQMQNRWNDVLSMCELEKRLKVKIDEARQRVRELEQEAEIRRQEAVTKVTERKVVENLKEKALTQYWSESLKEEQKLLDEVSVTKKPERG